MYKVFSKIEPGKLLHFIHSADEFADRRDLVAPSESLQLSSQLIPKGTKFRAHRHLPKRVLSTEATAQESWVVLAGEVMVSYFDIDDSFLESRKLSAGVVSVTLAGGHSYQAMLDSKVLEFKTGPYLGQNLDKVFID